MKEIIKNSAVTQLRNLARSLKIDIGDLKQIKGYRKRLQKRLRKELNV